MIAGSVTDDGVPVITLVVAGQTWLATIDAGVNGDVEYQGAASSVRPRFIGRISLPAEAPEEDVYIVDFPFDGRTLRAEATFVPDSEILIGTQLLQLYRLEIHFPERTVLLERVS